MESLKEVTLTKGLSKAVIDSSRGGKLRKLILTNPKTKKTHTIIDDQSGDDYFLCGGSFFLYPWVGRIRSAEIDFKDKKLTVEPLTKDPNGMPIHGLYFNTPRKIIQQAENILELTTQDSYKPYDEYFPNFCEKFILEEDRLRIENVFDGDSSKKYPLYFAYAYHPYFGLDGKSVDDLVLKHNMHHRVPLDEKTLLPSLSPEGNLVYEKIEKNFKSGEPLKDMKLDTLFYFDEKKAGLEEPVFQLIDPETKVAVEVASNISNERKNVNLVYWQVYTPGDRKTIAIEPMTSPGDAFNINFPSQVVTLKGQDDVVDGNFEIRIVSV